MHRSLPRGQEYYIVVIIRTRRERKANQSRCGVCKAEDKIPSRSFHPKRFTASTTPRRHTNPFQPPLLTHYTHKSIVTSTPFIALFQFTFLPSVPCDYVTNTYQPATTLYSTGTDASQLISPPRSSRLEPWCNKGVTHNSLA